MPLITNVTDTIGSRIEDIRTRLGSARKELSYQGLADEIRDRTGFQVSGPALRLYAKDVRVPPLDVISAIAAVDPLRRGRGWLAWHADGDGLGPPDAITDEP